MNISDSIASFSNLYKKKLINKEQFEAKIIDIVKSDVSNGISLNAIEDYLLPFKKMLDDDQIDQNIYNKISDLLLAKCEVSEKPQEMLHKETPKIMNNDNSTGESFNVEGALIVEEVQPNTDTHLSRRKNKPRYQNREKPPKIQKNYNFANVPPKVVGAALPGPQAYFHKGLGLIDLFKHDEGMKYMAYAAKLNHTEAIKYLKDNKIEKEDFLTDEPLTIEAKWLNNLQRSYENRLPYKGIDFSLQNAQWHYQTGMDLKEVFREDDGI